MKKLERLGGNKDIFAAVLIDLSKAFGCIPPTLLMAKLSTFGLDKMSLSFTSVYLNNSKQKIKKDSLFCGLVNFLRILWYAIFGSREKLYNHFCNSIPLSDDHSPNGDWQGQKMFLAPLVDNKTHNYD